MRSSLHLLFLTCLLSLFFLSSSLVLIFFFLLLFSHVCITIIFPFHLSWFSLILFSLNSFSSVSSSYFSSFSQPLHSLSSLSNSSPAFFNLSPFFFSYYIFEMLALFPLVGHNHNVRKILTRVKPLILHLRKLRLIEMELFKITCYVLETPSY